MDKSLSGGKLVNVTQYGNRLPAPKAPSRLSVAKEEARMEAEKDNLNAMEKISPNPLYQDKKKKGKAKAKLTPEKLGNMSQEELDELLSMFAQSGNEPMLESMRSATQTTSSESALQDLIDKYASSLSIPKVGFDDPSGGYRSPGFFQG